MKELFEVYEKTFADGRFSRAEKSAIRQLLKDYNLDDQQKNSLRSKMFDLVRSHLGSRKHEALVEWLEEANKTLLEQNRERTESRVYFSPGPDCLNAILSQLRTARSTIRICVFTISDDRIASEIMDAHRRKIDVQVITDNDKTADKGSDITAISNAGVPVRIDNTKNHMHHKFAVFDKEIALTGSYNWTRSAERYNEENVVVSNDHNLVDRFLGEFDRLWEALRSY